MMILIAYATVEGQTATIASHIGEQVEAAGHQADPRRIYRSPDSACLLA